MRQHRRGKRGGCSCGVGPRWQRGSGSRCPTRWNAVINWFYKKAYFQRMSVYEEFMGSFSDILFAAAPLEGKALDIPVVMRDSETEGSEWPPAPAVSNEAKEYPK